MKSFTHLLKSSNNFTLRRAVERLRDGLFDPFAVQLLTARESQLNGVFDNGVSSLSSKTPSHLCICGAYGQGKSHSLTYLHERALSQGFAASLINLDPREIPFHDFRLVYRALVDNIRFPDSDNSLAQYWCKWARKNTTAQVIPDSMPHFFKSVLTALAGQNMPLSKKQRRLKKHTAFRPREFSWLLTSGLKGENLPIYRLRHALKYRRVSFYKDASLVRKGWEPYFQAICSLAEMFQNMGLKGWVLLFDEGESIVQRPVNIRRKSYRILDHLFFPTTAMPGLYSIFAFTDDFFMRVRGEDYERFYINEGQELPYFDKNYGETWRNLHQHQLRNLSTEDWQDMITKLILLHGRAYNWTPLAEKIREKMAKASERTVEPEARLKIKGLIEQLDLAHQEIVLGHRETFATNVSAQD